MCSSFFSFSHPLSLSLFHLPFAYSITHPFKRESDRMGDGWSKGRDRWWREGKKGRETLGWNFHSNTHSLTPSLTLFRSFAHSFIHSFFHSLTPSLYLSFPSIIRSFAQSFLPSFIRSFSLSSPSPTSLLIRLWV